MGSKWSIMSTPSQSQDRCQPFEFHWFRSTGLLPLLALFFSFFFFFFLFLLVLIIFVFILYKIQFFNCTGTFRWFIWHSVYFNWQFLLCMFQINCLYMIQIQEIFRETRIVVKVYILICIQLLTNESIVRIISMETHTQNKILVCKTKCYRFKSSHLPIV